MHYPITPPNNPKRQISFLPTLRMNNLRSQGITGTKWQGEDYKPRFRYLNHML